MSCSSSSAPLRFLFAHCLLSLGESFFDRPFRSLTDWPPRSISSILLILNILSNFQVNLAYVVHSEQESDDGDRMDKMNMINRMCFAENESIDDSSVAQTSKAGQKMSATSDPPNQATLRYSVANLRTSVVTDQSQV